MTGRTDFTPEEWEAILEAPMTAGMIVVTAAHGGTFRETLAIGKAYADARKDGARAHAPPLTWSRFAEGVASIGHDGAGFAFDNESPRHRHYLQSYSLGPPAWGLGTVTYPLSGRTATEKCSGTVQLSWQLAGWVESTSQLLCVPS